MSSNSRMPEEMVKMALAAVLMMIVGCKAKPPSPPEDSGQTGIASWYGEPFNGRLTASGEVFDMHQLTAAHRTLALGTIVQVDNLSNHQSVKVRINDRGPFVQDRIIDLSYAAAQAISMPGVVTIRLKVISTPRTRAVNFYAVQVGKFASRDQAYAYRAEMVQRYGTARAVFRGRDQSWHILVGLFATEERASALANELNQKEGPAFVVLVDEDN